MGFGAALGVGVEAWQREDTRQTVKAQNERQADRLDRGMELQEEQNIRADKTHTANMALKGQQLQVAKEELKAYNDPEARKLRAMTKKNELKKVSLQNDMYDLMMSNESAGGGSSSKTAELENTVNKTAQKVEDQGAVANNDRVWTNMYTDIGATGTFNNLAQMNELIKNDKTLSMLIKGDLIKYNPNDEKMKQELYKMASQQSKMNGMPIDQVFPSLESLAKNGIIAFDSSNGSPKDLVGLATLTGVSKRMPKAIVDKANTVITTTGQDAWTKWNKDNNVLPAATTSTPGSTTATQTTTIAGVTDVAPWHVGQEDDPTSQLKQYKGRDAQRTMSTMQAIGIPVPEDLKQMVKDNAKLMEENEGGTGYWAGASNEQIVEGIDNILDTAEEGGPVTKQMLARARTGVASLETADDKNAYTKRLDFAEDTMRVNNIFDPNYNANTKDLRYMENVETAHLNQAGDKSDIGKKRDEVKADMGLAKDLNLAMAEMTKLQNEGGGLLSGFMADTLTEAGAKDPGLIDKIAEMSVGDNSPEAIKYANELRQQVLNSIKVKSRVGMILAKYIKSVSGAAVSDQEREFLTAVLQGAQNGNPKAMATAMSSFRDVLVESSERTAGDPYYRSMIPSTLYDVKENSDQLKVDYASGMSEGSSAMNTLADNYTESNSFMPQWMRDIGQGMKNAFTGESPEDRKAAKRVTPSKAASTPTNNWAQQYVD